MTHTPDEIKKGLECCMGLNGICCDGCPYDGKCNLFKQLATDALALIQQLEAKNAEKDARIQQLEAERDAAVKDLEEAKDCINCKHECGCKAANYDCRNCNVVDCPCKKCQYEWRGVQKEE